MKKFTLFVRMFDDVYDDGRFIFEAKDQKDANKKASGWARYHGMGRSDVMTRESEGRELNWAIDNECMR